MKIAIVSPYPPSKGTLNEYAYHLVKHFKAISEIEEIIILTDQIEEAYEVADAGEKIAVVPCWKFNDLLTPIKLIRTIRKHKAEVVLFNIQFLSFGDKKVAAAVGLMTPMLSRMLGVPCVTLLHNIIETVDYKTAGITTSKVAKFFYDLIGTSLTRMLLFSNTLAVTMPRYVTVLKEKYGVDNVKLIPHGSFEQIPLPEKEDDTVLRVMTFGKFGTYKKVEVMIAAVEQVRKKIGKKIEIVIAGTDNPNVKGYLAGVETDHAQIPDITYTGYVEEEDVPRIFQESTIVVFPYTSTTGSSGVLHQAGCYAKAVVLPNIGDLKELIEEEGYRGAYFEPDDVDGLAQAIEKLLTDKTYRLAMAAQNYKAASSIPMSTVAQLYLNEFQEIKNISGKLLTSMEEEELDAASMFI